jgi:hypothetical protein
VIAPFRLASMTPGPVNLWDYERLAAEKLDANAHAYYVGGAGDEVTLRDNLAAFERRKLRPRILVDVSSVTTVTTVLGAEIAMPILLAPVALQRMAHDEGELAAARAAARAGTIMCLSTAATVRPADVARAAPDGGRWFQVYVFEKRKLTEDLIDEAVASGFSALVVTVDAPFLGRRERDIRVDFTIPEHLTPAGDIFGLGFDASLSWRDLECLPVTGCPSSSRASSPPRMRRSRASTERLESWSRTTAAVSSTASPPRSTCSRRWSRPSTAVGRSTSTAAYAAGPMR